MMESVVWQLNLVHHIWLWVLLALLSFSIASRWPMMPPLPVYAGTLVGYSAKTGMRGSTESNRTVVL